MQAFGKVMQAKMSELEKAHPEFFNGRPPDSAEAQQKIKPPLIVPVLHEGAEASAQLPDTGKDGKITPLPQRISTP